MQRMHWQKLHACLRCSQVMLQTRPQLIQAAVLFSTSLSFDYQPQPHLPAGGGCSTRLSATSTMACASDTLRKPPPGCAPLKMSRDTAPCSAAESELLGDCCSSWQLADSNSEGTNGVQTNQTTAPAAAVQRATSTVDLTAFLCALHTVLVGGLASLTALVGAACNSTAGSCCKAGHGCQALSDIE